MAEPALPQSGRHDFTSIAYGVRIHSGLDALAQLGPELRRIGCQRPLLLCGASVMRTGLPDRIVDRLGGRECAIFSGLTKEAPLPCVEEAVQTARRHGSDALVAIGAGSVLKAARVVAILLAEARPVAELVTRYPESGPAVGVHLAAPKLPIFNVLTAATTAQCRAGSALMEQGWEHRLEFFDPKTRPRAIFWDSEALMTAPKRLALDNGCVIYWRALMSMAVIEQANPLVQASRRQAWALSTTAMSMLTAPASSPAPGPRIDLCAAALLQNRDEDDGGAPMQAHLSARLVYALAAAVFTKLPHVSQAGATAALTPAALRVGHCSQPGVLQGIARAMQEDLSDREVLSPDTIVDLVGQRLTSFGQPSRLSQIIPDHTSLSSIAAFARKSFNADRDQEFSARPGLLSEVLRMAW